MADAPLADSAALHDLVAANRILAHERVLDAYGHVSIRHPERADQYVIARSLGPELVTAADLQCFTLDGTQVGGADGTPYSERFIHGAIYEARPDVRAICHNHAPSVIPFSVTSTPLRPIYHMAALLGPEVPKWDIAAEFGANTDLLVRTMEQGRSLSRALGPRRVVLMRGHGSAVAGGSLPEVVWTCVYMAENARLQLQAMALGEVQYLSPGEIEQMGGYQVDPRGFERAWHAWRARVGMAD
ncbi:MAG TPA: class II aldolase/adducin family protein [Chloroflexota bacterium]|nr:class II aldolase/adducin family protein [Chloroflexota bacterium]